MKLEKRCAFWTYCDDGSLAGIELIDDMPPPPAKPRMSGDEG